MKEQKFEFMYSVIELKRNGIYEYYLSKDNHGDLFYMYGTPKRCEPIAEMVEEYAAQAINEHFWWVRE